MQLYSAYSNLKASMIERFNRTFKNMMWLQFSLHGNYKCVETLPLLVSKYNDTKHRTISMKPEDFTTDNEEELRKRFYEHGKIPMKRQKFKVGDKVRVSKLKNSFEKGYIANWSTEIFTISQVISNKQVTYKLKDYQDQPIAGGFYQEDLVKRSSTLIFIS